MGRLENTIFIFLTDNGTAVGFNTAVTKEEDGVSRVTHNGYNAGMRGKKSSPYEGGHRAACFIRWPAGGIKAGKDIDHLTAHFDLMPTLKSLCGLMVPEDHLFDGTDLSPLLLGEGKEPWPERTLFVHHQGRFGQPVKDDGLIKYKDYVVMTEKWRMVGKELYNIKDDPGQKVDLADAYPGIMDELRDAYEEWWDDVYVEANDYCRTIVGSEYQPVTVLTCLSWHGEEVPYNQQHVRNALISNGFWDISVEQAGIYSIELRRWPREVDEAIDKTIPPETLDPDKHEISNRIYSIPSRGVSAVSARLRTGDFDRTVAVEPGQKKVSFEVMLEQGDINLQTWLMEEDGTERGAYYVYVERLR